MIRITAFILCFLLTKENSFSQIFINFENTAHDTLIKIDTVNPSNIWQIGKPQKFFFDSAASFPNVLITDTLNYYSVNNQSSFTIKISDTTWFNICQESGVSFLHKYDTDSLKDGGYIEVSFDNGNTWSNIVNCSTCNSSVYSSSDTIIGDISAISGHSDWKMDYICVWNLAWPDAPTISLKFIFQSDSLQDNKEGWMIDNISLIIGCDVCLGRINEVSSKSIISISPNPFTNESILEFIDQNDKMIEVEIFNSIGNKVSVFENISGNKLRLNRNNFSEGLYFYKIKTKNNYSESGKLVVQ